MNSIDQFPEEGRIWVYQSPRSFTQKEKEIIHSILTPFVGQWAAHGQPLTATYELLYEQFIAIAVNEAHHSATGCSIDSSVAAIRQIGQRLGLDLLDKGQVGYLVGGEVRVLPFQKVKSAVAEEEISPDTTIFDNSVATVGQWKEAWKVPASRTWIGRFLVIH